jgi:sulfate/thiosulfate transport system substrate-binding protein
MSLAARLRRATSIVFVLAIVGVLPIFFVGCGSGGSASGSGSGSGGGSTTLSLVGYSTIEEAYDELTPTFAETKAGKGVLFTSSYGPSGDQSRAVEAGQPADVVAFSLEPDMTRLVEDKLVDSDWNKNEYKGMITDSVVALVVRKGNPKNINDWDDLTKPGVEVITPNPFSSGGAKWNIMAAYGAQLKQGKSPAEAKAYLKDLFSNVPVEPGSARDALTTFTGGKGDVLISYENEAILAQREDSSIEYSVPDQTILIENPIAVTSNTEYPKQANAFLDFLYTSKAQHIFGDVGYRPVDKQVLKDFDFPTPPELFTIDDLGGWEKVDAEFFDDPQTSVMAKINRELGQPTE